MEIEEAGARAPGGAEERLRRLMQLTPAAVYAAVQSAAAGLDATEAARRLAEHGPNRIEEVRGPGLARKLLAQFVHLFALLLWAGAALAFVAGMPSLGIAIVAVIVLNGAFGFFQEHRAERAVAALKRLLPPHATVLRDGTERQLPAEDVVPGDVLVLREGDRVSADARLVDASDLRVDESGLTGESHPVQKAARPDPEPPANAIHAHDLVFAGSTVIAGEGRAVVVATGMGTEFGRIASLTQAVREQPSPLQKEVARVARIVAVLSVAMGVVFFAIGYVVAGLTLTDGAVFAIGIVLGNVPEGLLPTMTLALAVGVQRMARRNAIVKRLSSVETLGSCSVICTDKTGTLTANQMTVRELWAGGRRVRITGTGYRPDGELVVEGRSLSRAELAPFVPMLRIGHLCNTARLLPPAAPGAPWGLAGDPTEGALLVAAAKAGLDHAFDARMRPVVRKLAFDPRRKRMSTVHGALPEELALVAYVKGAPRELLDHCVAALVAGDEIPLTEEMRSEIRAENDRMARAGLRVLAMAYRDLPAEDWAALAELEPGAVETELVFAGLAGMQDPPREEVPAAMESTRRAGIRVIMITGDYGLTAESIARQVGLVDGERATVVEAAELEAMSDGALRAALREGASVFARATPEHKLRIVAALRALGHVVAVTGDGVNDAPALKEADIGVAMGLSGTDVAREAADMVLVDDNFATIVAAIREGRAIFDNMRKFIAYILAHLTPEVVPYVCFALFRIPLPLTVMQILAIDLGTETLPALALGVERPEPDVMSRPPRPRGEGLLGVPALLRGYVLLGMTSAVVVLGAYFAFLLSRGWRWGQQAAPTAQVGAMAATVVFLGIVLMQVGNAFACRTERASALRGLLTNRFLLIGIVFELVVAMLVIYVPPLQPAFGTAALPPVWWAVPAAFIPVVFLVDEARKALARRRAGRG
jgi:magnesium-transporting ATPase (P-type)